jgi:serine/threonine-protein kinase
MRMTPERHQHIKRLFLAAVELAPQEAHLFLDSACGEDQELRREVQSLLDHHRNETLLEAASSQETGGAQTSSRVATLQETLPFKLAEDAVSTRPAGTMIASRYRLVALVGRGGMGVVYRAEDVELGQTVALKFINPLLRQQPKAVDFLRREVRIARQITHPNVVRIFDIAISDVEVFISMEFVAGEDLGSLVRRVGPLPPAKVMQIAQQLAAGLAAAHEAGILHRDLKPANVMIDGSGNVRILDFGIAAPLADERSLREAYGTPGFIAPELMAGKEPSRSSDLFAWGLVVYYAAAGMLPDLQHFQGDQGVDDPLWSTSIGDELATCVRSCLQSDPARRPKLAHDLLAALSPSDPLREALQAGRTPSPELVTAAVSWQPVILMIHGLLATGVALLALIALLADRTLFLSRCGLTKSPEALREIAEQVIARFGHPLPEGPVLTGGTFDTNGLQYVRDHLEIPDVWQKVATGEVPAISFSYRHGDPRLPPPALLGESYWGRRIQPLPGTATIRLDGRGKLLSAQIAASVPGELPPSTPLASGELFDMAGLPQSQFRETSVYRWPPNFADEVHAWEGPFPADPNKQVRVTAASLDGRVVFFDADQPWEISQPMEAAIESGRQSSRFVAVRTALWLIAIVLAAGLAWRHISLGHADWRGAWRVTACVFVLASLDWLCGSRHTFIVAEELTAGFLWLNAIVFCSVIAGVAYLAVEPSARRWWPWSIITIRRLLDGRLADREVWADVLLGLVVGLGSVVLRQLCTLSNQLLGLAVSGLNDFDLSQNLLDNFGLRYRFAVFVSALLMAILESLLLLTLVVSLKRLTKSTLITTVLLIVLLASLAIAGRGITSPIDWLARLLLSSIAAWLLLRCGLLATITALTTFYAVNNTPITLDWSKWYALTGFYVVGIVIAALVVCWRLARPRRESDRFSRHAASTGLR